MVQASNIVGSLVIPEATVQSIRDSWSKETTAYAGWSSELPEAGQCAVTALLVQDIVGGVLMRAVVNGESHYWNKMDNGTEIDLTRAQFQEPLVFEDVMERDRDYLIGNRATLMRYGTLTHNFYLNFMANA